VQLSPLILLLLYNMLWLLLAIVEPGADGNTSGWWWWRLLLLLVMVVVIMILLLQLLLLLMCKLWWILTTKNDPKIRDGGGARNIIIITLKSTGGVARQKGLVRILQFLQTIVVCRLNSEIWERKRVKFLIIIIIKSQRSQALKRVLKILTGVAATVSVCSSRGATPHYCIQIPVLTLCH
jgi:hypothetical protein